MSHEQGPLAIVQRAFSVSLSDRTMTKTSPVHKAPATPLEKSRRCMARKRSYPLSQGSYLMGSTSPPSAICTFVGSVARFISSR